MEADSWKRFSAPSKRHPSALQQPYVELHFGFEEMEAEEDESRVEFSCPFCDEDFDIVGLCCHLDEEHPFETKNEICPICLGGVAMDMVGHITAQHANLFKLQRKMKLRRGSSGSNHAKEIRDVNIHSLLGGSSHLVAPFQAAPDPLLSLFISNLSIPDSDREIEPQNLDAKNKVSEERVVESCGQFVFLCDKDQKEMALRSQFVQGLLLSTIMEDL